jgi:hypothetical protein
MRYLAAIAIVSWAFASALGTAAEPCQAPQRIVVIPFTSDEASRPFLPVTLEGRATQLSLSTSLPFSALRKEVVRQFNIRTVRGNSVARVSEFKLGDIPFGSTVDFMIDERESTKPVEKDGGVAGLNALTRYDLEIDNAGRTISLFDENHCKGASVHWAEEALTLTIDPRRPTKYLGTEVKAKDDDNQIILPIARVVVAGKEASALFDTSSARTTVDVFFAKDHLGVTPAPPFKHTFKSFSVSGMTFENMTADLARLNRVDVVLGMSELKKLRLYFAFKDRMIHITAADAERSAQ